MLKTHFKYIFPLDIHLTLQILDRVLYNVEWVKRETRAKEVQESEADADRSSLPHSLPTNF